MTHRTGRLGALVLLGVLVAIACGGDGAAPVTDGTGSSGQIVISGSSTVEPITARVAEAFEAVNPSIAISVDGPGTADGLVLFCNGETDITNASRAIKDSELETCLANGIEPIEITVAIDGLSVLTAPDNRAVSCLDFGDLYALLGSESVRFDSWADANGLASELAAAGLGGSHAPYPDAHLVVTGPGEESGTFDSFVDLVLAEIAGIRGTDELPRIDYVSSPNDNVIISGIRDNPASLGWVGYAFFVENQDIVKALEIDGGDGCVAPSPETIASGAYPIARPLFIYVSKAAAEQKAEVAAFVDFYLSEEGITAVDAAGYVRLTDEELATAVANWESRTAKGG